MQGFNMGRYYPPDASNPPSFNTTSHPLGKRASKISQGILTVRFELPFAVWCNHCTPPAIIGQGVRFNAEKKKVGKYYSTPIWSFRMKHSACGGWWEIRTDPQNCAYVVVEGARRRDYGPDEGGKNSGENGEGDGELKFLTEEERETRRNDAFANFEGKVDEKEKKDQTKERLDELYHASEVWRDPYDVNAKLRRDFRAKRKVWNKEDRWKEGVKEKYSLGIEIVDEVESDRQRAKLVQFGSLPGDQDQDQDQKQDGGDDAYAHTAARIPWKPLFTDSQQLQENEEEEAARQLNDSATPTTKKLKSQIAAEKTRLNLRKTVVGNTKAAIDPFLSREGPPIQRVNLGLLKRKREGDGAGGRDDDGGNDGGAGAVVDLSGVVRNGGLMDGDGKGRGKEKMKELPALPCVLVGYDSD